MIGRSSAVDSTIVARRTAAWLAAAAVWSCSGSATTDASAGGGTIASIEVSPPTSSLAVGAQLPLTAVARDIDGKIVPSASLVWSVRDPSIASVSSSGVVTGVALGTTQVAASANGKSGIAAITVQKTPVASVVVRPNHIDAVPGMHTQLTAVAYDAANDILADRAVIWATSNSGVANVDQSGAVTAVAPGTATISATAEGKSDAATITVVQAPVATVTVTPNPLGMSVGQKTQLTATLRDSSGNVVTGQTVTWTSSNTAVATVSNSGEVTAVSAGTTTVTATSEGKTGTTAITISNFAVGTVSVQPQSSTIVKGGSVQLSATVKDVNGTVVTDRVVSWSSSNTAAATVSTTGLVTGVGAGTATITATSEGVSGAASVTVSDPVASVTVQPADDTILAGQSVALTAVLKDANGTVLSGRTVTWTTSDGTVATVSASGVVTGVAAGSATITATSEGKSGTAQVTVNPVPAGTVTVSPASASVTVGDTTRLTATVKDANGNVVTNPTVTWSTSNASVATVSSSGLVTGVDSGKVTITASANGGSGTATVTVVLAPVATVTVQPASATIAVGQTTTLTATTKDASGNVLTGRAITWSSSDPTIATVSQSGVVTGVLPGSATISATSEGKTGTAAITVTLAPVATVTVSPDSAAVVQGQTAQFTATTKDALGNTLTGRTITWSSSNTSVATVDATGKATAVATGGPDTTGATITATSEGKSGTAKLVVYPLPVDSVAVSPTSATLKRGQTKQFTATALDATGKVLTGRTFTWTSSDPTIATVDQTGLVTAVTDGKNVIITATSEGKSGTATVTVSK